MRSGPDGTYTLSPKLRMFGWVDGDAEAEVSPSEPTARITVEDVSYGGGHVYVTGSSIDPLDGPYSASSDYGAYVAKYTAGDTDTDGDALPDRWEIEGYTDPKTGGKVDLPKMGADPLHKDIFVEVDYMDTRKPNVDSVFRAVKAFAEADGVANPDGTTGINLHVDSGPTPQ